MTDDDIRLPPTSAVTDESSTFLDLGDLAPVLPSPSQAEPDDVIEGIPCEVVDPTVLAAIARNLGKVPANLVRVAASYTTRQNQVEPAVLVLYPLRDCTNDYKKHHRATAEPFPTMYWLASPELHERVSLLEGAGFVTRFTDRLAASPKHLQVRLQHVVYIFDLVFSMSGWQAMTDMHAAYASERWALLTPADRLVVEKKQWVRALQTCIVD
ncbi:hypothetical protein DYB35_008742 [Aphanomyces astaci]|uniref:Uncharacterized protein n=1 Tax=Aphanomyces astaci TaxID=112090 RepID=A0A418DKZ5_APHAT|nr:hypothetical protein DYB35_008742 [Aphanomyces astaci]